MKRFLHTCAATCALVGMAPAAHAVSLTLSDVMTQDADTLVYEFTGLPAAGAGPGTLTIATIDDGSSFIGVDIEQPGEYMDVVFDGTDLGRFECDEPDDGGTLIPGATPGVLGFDCLFSFDISIDQSVLNAAIADGAVTVSLVFGPETNHFDELDQIDVTLSYTPVPLPASALLLLGALGGVAALRRRKA